MCAYYNDAGACTQNYPGTFLFVHADKKLNRSGSLKDYTNSIYFQLGDTVGFVHNFGRNYNREELAQKKGEITGRFLFTAAPCGNEKELFTFSYKVERHDFYSDRVAGLSLLGTIVNRYHKKRGWEQTNFQDWQTLCPGNSITPFKLDGKLTINGIETNFPILIIP